MKQLVSLALAAAVLCPSAATAEELKSGLEKGKGIGPFYVTKTAGAEDDGVAEGQNLCYRCKNGARPQVMVFTRSTDQKVVSLVQKLDEQLQKNEEAQLRAFVNMLGTSKDAAESDVKKLAVASKAKNVPFVVPNEFENGPEDYGINPKAEITIIIANEAKVVSNHAAASAKDLDLNAVLGDLKKMLN
ncbi:MAG: hypothetical protein KDA45_13395 [Planctomycetales bacterium]|nr:hypothetical protein [Planctomycetales bacterium]